MGTARKRIDSNIESGVKLDQVDAKVVKSAYVEAAAACEMMSNPPMQLPDPSKLDTRQMVANLVNWFRLTTDEDRIVVCDKCGGDSDEKLPTCPYCGTAGVEGEEQETEDRPLVKVSSKDIKAKKLEKSEPSPEEAIEDEPEKLIEEVDPEIEEDKAEEVIDEPEPEPVRVPGRGRPKPAKSPKGKSKSAIVNSIVETDNGDDDPRVEVIDRGIATELDLDSAVERINSAKLSAATNIWQMGNDLRIIHERSLWRNRLNDGKPAYKSFKDFCKVELDFSYPHVKRLIAVAEAFPKEVMEKIGVAKCSVMLSLPPAVRKEMVKDADVKSVAQLSDEAKRLRDGEAPAPPPKGSLTVAMAPGIVEIPLVARPKKPGSKVSDKPAKSLTDDPIAIENLPNKVQVTYGLIRRDDGSLMLRITRRRVSTDEVFASEASLVVEE
jgi:hypothetical protein